LTEILNEDGAPCSAGQTGRVVVTDLHNFATPLIRYEIGDHAVVGEPCLCGRGLPVLTRILGRSRNMLTLPSGARVWPRLSSKTLSGIPAIRQVQFVQHEVDAINVRLAVSRPLSPAEEATLADLLAKNLGHPFGIRFDYVDEIERAANGKFEDFVSHISAEAAVANR
jgi:phenylacetate-CoA ligase